MLIGIIDGATNILGAPKNWNEAENGKCGRLAVRAAEVGGMAIMTSAWFPTPEELDALIAGAPIYLTVIGAAHPPVAMGVGPVPKAGL